EERHGFPGARGSAKPQAVRRPRRACDESLGGLGAMPGPPSKMRYGFVIDHRKCIGCHACTVACKEENQVPLGTFRTWVKYVEKGTWPHTRRYFSVLRCNHCDDAPCVTICPTVALYRRADGIVDFDGARCIGCKSCMQGCPYDALYIDPNTNTAAKCHYCAHRLEVGLEPACVIVCPERAIIAGDLDDSRTEIARLVAREQVEVRKPEQGTRPKVYYVGADSSALSPTLQRAAPTYLWGQRPQAEADLVSMVAALQPSGHGEEALARPVYDAPHAPRPVTARCCSARPRAETSGRAPSCSHIWSSPRSSRAARRCSSPRPRGPAASRTSIPARPPCRSMCPLSTTCSGRCCSSACS